MTWGGVELEPEVRLWLEGLSTAECATAAWYVELLARERLARALDAELVVRISPHSAAA
jgi:hypothetical protein